ncbi:MAG: hypothetical protein DME09_14350 [Candidatus Rokuibacteriota bacterium]|nr:MAG: hypothetical protein DME09_14350 [Candidatus Rokubacteria bacterium]
MPSLPSATTSREGVAPGTSTRIGPEPPRSASARSREAQVAGAKKSAGSRLKLGPGPRRMTASPSPQLDAPKVFPVAT